MISSSSSRGSLPQPWLEDKKRVTPEDLEKIITAPAGGLYMSPSNAMDEVWPNLYIGEHGAAINVLGLQNRKFTHILNVAMGKTRYHCNTNALMYRKVGITFLGVEGDDTALYNLMPHFEKTSKFIHKALSQPDGKILVHCRVGASRSATIVLAYLMLKHNKTVTEATTIVRGKREIGPNTGFLRQLCELQEMIDHGDLKNKRNAAACLLS